MASNASHVSRPDIVRAEVPIDPVRVAEESLQVNALGEITLRPIDDLWDADRVDGGTSPMEGFDYPTYGRVSKHIRFVGETLLIGVALTFVLQISSIPTGVSAAALLAAGLGFANALRVYLSDV